MRTKPGWKKGRGRLGCVSHFSEILCWDQLDLEVILHFFDNFMTFQAYN